MCQLARRSPLPLVRALACACVLAIGASAQASESAAQDPPRPPQPAAGRAPAPPQFQSPEVAADARITFRIFAPAAQAVRLSAGDIPGMMGPAAPQLTKAEDGVWSVTVGPVAAGAYRYTFNVDGVSTVDPRNPAISESNNNVWSLVVVPGSDLFDTTDVPHGAVSAVTYRSSSLGRFRRMHVYTPPGYENGQGRFPVLYLLHGAGDNDDAWTSVGRAGFILDNLIAAGRARPMIVVMPAGHVSRGPGSPIGRSATDAFTNDFIADVMPYVESRYRVLTDRAHTAIAGLSMGGGQALAVAVPRLGRFGHIAIFSSGLLGAFPELAPAGPARAPAGPPAAAPPTAAEWEQQHAATLSDPALKAGLQLFWFGTGHDDFLLSTTRATVEFFKKHGFSPVFRETPGGHTWIVWRDYLAEIAPLLFQSTRPK